MLIEIDGKTKKLDEWLMDDSEAEELEILKKLSQTESRFELKTSGSTGKPKVLSFSKVELFKSSQLTANTFDLSRESCLLNVLPLQYVAGFMMVVRAYYLGCNLICRRPSSNPFEKFESHLKPIFTALTPFQIEHILEEGSALPNSLKSVILGGGPLNKILEDKLFNIKKPSIYHTYGMTETLTHVAYRKINSINKENIYSAVDGFKFHTGKKGKLEIFNQLKDEWIITNDRVELIDEKHFRWLGRLDFVINSGGVKIQIEETEERIRQIAKGIFDKVPKLVLSSLNDDSLGEKAVLVVEREELDHDKILEELRSKLPKHHAPRLLIRIPKIPLNPNGKIDRLKLKRAINLPDGH